MPLKSFVEFLQTNEVICLENSSKIWSTVRVRKLSENVLGKIW